MRLGWPISLSNASSDPIRRRKVGIVIFFFPVELSLVGAYSLQLIGHIIKVFHMPRM